MCGIAGVVDLGGGKVPNLPRSLEVMNRLQHHRGPDDGGIWTNPSQSVGLAHRRLTIIDLSEQSKQPMLGPNDTVISYNGEIYNHLI